MFCLLWPSQKITLWIFRPWNPIYVRTCACIHTHKHTHTHTQSSHYCPHGQQMEGKECRRFWSKSGHLWASLVAQAVKNPPAMQEAQIESLDQKDPLEKEMATHSSSLAWRIPMDRGTWRAIVHGAQRVGHDRSDLACAHTCRPFMLFNHHNTASGYHFHLTEDEMVGWHHWLNGHEFGWTSGVGDGKGGLACCGSWGRKESDTTERLNWTELNRI